MPTRRTTLRGTILQSKPCHSLDPAAYGKLSKCEPRHVPPVPRKPTTSSPASLDREDYENDPCRFLGQTGKNSRYQLI